MTSSGFFLEVKCGCIAAFCQWVYLKYRATVTVTDTHETSEHDTTLATALHILIDVLLMYSSTWCSAERLLCEVREKRLVTCGCLSFTLTIYFSLMYNINIIIIYLIITKFNYYILSYILLVVVVLDVLARWWLNLSSCSSLRALWKRSRVKECSIL